jgi:tetratricopeptide (TPR) repeat protein
MTWAPGTFDYRQAQEFLGGAPKRSDSDSLLGFRAALEAAHGASLENGGATGLEGGTQLWWLGWARFLDADWKGSEEAFQASLACGPEFTNAWFYLALARQYSKDSAGALAAIHSGCEADAATMVSAAQGAGGSLKAFESLIGWCAMQEPALNLEAAFLAELLTQAFPEEPRHWNNLGLFLRDEGERMEMGARHGGGAEPDPATLADLYRQSYAAYRRALELNPDDPQLLNDTALMVQYHVDGDPAEVEAMYRRSVALLAELLADPALSPDDRARFEQTKSDVSGNLERLLSEKASAPAATN